MDELDQAIAAVEWLVAAAMRHRVAAAAAMGLPPRDLIALDFLLRDPGLSPGVLSHLLMLTPGGTAGTLRRLQETGLVRRTSAGGNRRSVHVWLTSAGLIATCSAPIGLGEIIRASANNYALAPDARSSGWIRAIANNVEHDTEALIERAYDVSRAAILPARVRWG